MNSLKILCLCAVAAFALAACGGSSYCADSATAYDSLVNTKMASCPTGKAQVSAYPPLRDTACTTALTSCSSADDTLLATQITCMNALANCTVDDGTYFVGLSACQKAGMCKTSAACIAAFGMTTVCAAIP